MPPREWVKRGRAGRRAARRPRTSAARSSASAGSSRGRGRRRRRRRSRRRSSSRAGTGAGAFRFVEGKVEDVGKKAGREGQDRHPANAIAIPSPKRWRLWLVWARRNAATKTPRYTSTRSASVTLSSTEPDQSDERADQIARPRITLRPSQKASRGARPKAKGEEATTISQTRVRRYGVRSPEASAGKRRPQSGRRGRKIRRRFL